MPTRQTQLPSFFMYCTTSVYSNTLTFKQFLYIFKRGCAFCLYLSWRIDNLTRFLGHLFQIWDGDQFKRRFCYFVFGHVGVLQSSIWYMFSRPWPKVLCGHCCGSLVLWSIHTAIVWSIVQIFEFLSYTPQGLSPYNLQSFLLYAYITQVYLYNGICDFGAGNTLGCTLLYFTEIFDFINKI